ncbi:MAG: hypothetical protein JW757_04145 [Anaerolineales bacterium]|nr:hypothetical protein [Anaerolineales bacterium]
MLIAKVKELAVSGKLTTIIKFAFMALVLASSLLFGSEVLAGPIPGGIGG